MIRLPWPSARATTPQSSVEGVGKEGCCCQAMAVRLFYYSYYRGSPKHYFRDPQKGAGPKNTPCRPVTRLGGKTPPRSLNETHTSSFSLKGRVSWLRQLVQQPPLFPRPTWADEWRRKKEKCRLSSSERLPSLLLGARESSARRLSPRPLPACWTGRTQRARGPGAWRRLEGLEAGGLFSCLARLLSPCDRLSRLSNEVTSGVGDESVVGRPWRR